MSETENTTTDWYSDDVATFGDRLSGARQTSGLSQEQLAKRLGVRITTLRAWEDDTAEPRSNRLQMLAGMLNVSIRWLLTGEGEGLDGPVPYGTLSDSSQSALTDLRSIRARLLSLAHEAGHLEKRLRHLLRDDEEQL